MTYPNYHIVVVDNGSTDGTESAVRTQYPEVTVIVNPRNLGFTGGTNVGIRHALSQGADYVFLINNDTFVEPTILDELIAYAGSPGVGIVGPKIYCADDPQRIWSVGAKRHPLTLEMIDKGYGRMDVGQWEEVAEQDYLLGCAQLFKRSVLEEIGLLDEAFFLYCDDMDICLRAHEAGYRMLMVPQAKMWHKGAASVAGGKSSPRVRYYSARSSTWLFRKHVRGLRWLIVGPYRFGSAVKTFLRLAMQKKWVSVRAHLLGLRDGLTMTGEFDEPPDDTFVTVYGALAGRRGRAK
jgi:GT2 family glycosyltransferase